MGFNKQRNTADSDPARDHQMPSLVNKIFFTHVQIHFIARFIVLLPQKYDQMQTFRIASKAYKIW